MSTNRSRGSRVGCGATPASSPRSAGLAAALHSGDPAYEGLPEYFRQQLVPALQSLLNAAEDAGQVRTGVEPSELLRAVGSLSTAGGADGAVESRRMVDLVIDGLRFGAPEAPGAGAKRRRSR